jgi:hypothetical protein
MPANQRRYAQAIPVVYISIGIAVLICLGTFGIKTLLLKQQLKQGGERLSRLRKEISELNTSNQSLLTEKNRLTSVPALTKAIADGFFIKLKPIDPRVVVNVRAGHHTVATTVGLPDSEGGR